MGILSWLTGKKGEQPTAPVPTPEGAAGVASRAYEARNIIDKIINHFKAARDELMQMNQTFGKDQFEV